MNKKIEITPDTKIGELLDNYPQLEDLLLSFSPSFAKLNNPILRKTIGKVASLRQVAQIGGLNLSEMILLLRKEAGQNINDVTTEDEPTVKSIAYPYWLDIENITITLDVCDIIDKGESPMKDILDKVNLLSKSDILLLITPFDPIPIKEILNAKQFISWTESKDNKVYSYFKKD